MAAGFLRRRRRESLVEGDARSAASSGPTPPAAPAAFVEGLSESEGLGALASSEAPCNCADEASESAAESEEAEKAWRRSRPPTAAATNREETPQLQQGEEAAGGLRGASGGRAPTGLFPTRPVLSSDAAVREGGESPCERSAGNKTLSVAATSDLPPVTAAAAGSSAAFLRPSRGGARNSIAQAAALSADASLEKWERKVATFRVRCRWTLILICLFFLILSAGHAFCMVLVLAIIAAIYREIIQAKETPEELRLHDFYLLKWYWFFTTIVGIGLPWAVPRLWGLAPSTVEALESYHSLGIYVMFLVGFIWFVLSLRKGHLRYQFSQFGLAMGVLIVVVSQSLIQVANIYSGLIWFFLPSSLVIVNDIFAYLFGTAFGRTRLIKLSPKKTVEGYVGAAAMTLLWAWVVGRQLESLQLFVCPQPYISFKPFAMFFELQCTPSPVYLPTCTDLTLDRFGKLWRQTQDADAGSSALSPAAAVVEDPRNQALRERRQQLLQRHAELLDAKVQTEEELRALQRMRHSWRQAASAGQDPSAEAPSGALSASAVSVSVSVSSAPCEAAGGVAGGDFFAREAALEEQKAQIGAALSLVDRARAAAEAEMRSQCRSLWAAPFDLHAMVLGSFAAFFAPFGGFFASGFKRAVRIKARRASDGLTPLLPRDFAESECSLLDFGYFIPGHGGVTDRFDCQVTMGLFTFLYQKTFVPQIREAEEAARRRALLLPGSSPSSSLTELSRCSAEEQRQVLAAAATSAEDKGGFARAASLLRAAGGMNAEMQRALVEAVLKAAEALDDAQLFELREKLKQLAASRQLPAAAQREQRQLTEEDVPAKPLLVLQIPQPPLPAEKHEAAAPSHGPLHSQLAADSLSSSSSSRSSERPASPERGKAAAAGEEAAAV